MDVAVFRVRLSDCSRHANPTAAEIRPVRSWLSGTVEHSWNKAIIQPPWRVSDDMALELHGLWSLKKLDPGLGELDICTAASGTPCGGLIFCAAAGDSVIA